MSQDESLRAVRLRQQEVANERAKQAAALKKKQKMLQKQSKDLETETGTDDFKPKKKKKKNTTTSTTTTGSRGGRSGDYNPMNPWSGGSTRYRWVLLPLLLSLFFP